MKAVRGKNANGSSPTTEPQYHPKWRPWPRKTKQKMERPRHVLGQDERVLPDLYLNCYWWRWWWCWWWQKLHMRQESVPVTKSKWKLCWQFLILCMTCPSNIARAFSVNNLAHSSPTNSMQVCITPHAATFVNFTSWLTYLLSYLLHAAESFLRS